MFDEIVGYLPEIRIGSVFRVEVITVDDFEVGVDNTFAVSPYVRVDYRCAYDMENGSDLCAVGRLDGSFEGGVGVKFGVVSVVYTPTRTSKVPVGAVAGRAVGEGQEVVVGVTVVALVVGVGVFSWKDYLSKCCVEGL